MGTIKCKMCGSNLETGDSVTVCKCDSCGTSQTVPDIADDKELKLFERANKLRINCDYDKALGVYDNITDDYPEEAEGYWGKILCKYGIEYVEDEKTSSMIPVCHRTSYDSVMEDEDFELVMENSDSESRAVYRYEAKVIEETRKKYIDIAENEKPYDIFISYRIADENGERTAVSELAEDIYKKLTDAGYKVFLSQEALKDISRSDSEPYIFAALKSAYVMLALGTSYDDYNDVWVKNEWNRYIAFADADKTKHLIPCYKDVDEYDIPKEFASLKMIELGRDDTFDNIMSSIKNSEAANEKLNSDKESAEVKEEEDMAAKQDDQQEKEAESKEEAAESTQEEVIELEIFETADPEEMISDAYKAIAAGNNKEANKLFYKVLDIEPENSLAYWGQLLIQQESADAKDMADNIYVQAIGSVSKETIELEIKDRKPDIIKNYPVAELFSQEEFDALFDMHYYYETGVASVESAIAENKEHYILSDNELFKRAQLYANDEVKAYIDEFINAVDKHLEDTLNEVKLQEQQSVAEARKQEEEYFSKLENAFKLANNLAEFNKAKNEKEFQDDHKLWEQERDNLEAAKEQWEKDVVEKQKEHDDWLEANKDVLDRWNAEKKQYFDDKMNLEYELKRLQEDKGFIEGFMAEARAAKKDKEIMNVRIELSKLAMPSEPFLPKEPVIPPEPVLRREPEKDSFDDMVGRTEVLDAFRNYMGQ